MNTMPSRSKSLEAEFVSKFDFDKRPEAEIAIYLGDGGFEGELRSEIQRAIPPAKLLRNCEMPQRCERKRITGDAVHMGFM